MFLLLINSVRKKEIHIKIHTEMQLNTEKSYAELCGDPKSKHTQRHRERGKEITHRHNTRAGPSRGTHRRRRDTQRDNGKQRKIEREAQTHHSGVQKNPHAETGVHREKQIQAVHMQRHTWKENRKG